MTLSSHTHTDCRYTASCLFVGLWKLQTGIKQSEHTSIWFLNFSIQSLRFQILVQDCTRGKISHEARLIIHRRPLLIFFVCSPPSCSHATALGSAVLLLLSSNPSLHLALPVLYLHLWRSYESLLKNCIHETPLALARLIWAGDLWWLVSVQWLELLHILQALHYPTGTAFEAKSSFGLDIDSGLLNLRETVTIPWAALTT